MKFDDDMVKYIISRLIEKADIAHDEFMSDPSNDFKSGQTCAYYEMLDVLHSELEISGADLEKFGLNFDPIKYA